MSEVGAVQCTVVLYFKGHYIFKVWIINQCLNILLGVYWEWRTRNYTLRGRVNLLFKNIHKI